METRSRYKYVFREFREELQDYLHYELTSYPSSLFSDEKCGEGTKSLLFKAFVPIADNFEYGDSIYIIDGGFLLHRIVWYRNQSFGAISENYVQYVSRHYGNNAIVVFDGYPSNAANKSAKSAERYQRSRKHNSVVIHFEESMIATISQEKFLSNENNKVRLMSMLKNINNLLPIISR